MPPLADAYKMPVRLEAAGLNKTRGDVPDAGVCGNRTNKRNRAKLRE